MSQSADFQLITMSEMEHRGTGSYFIPDTVKVLMSKNELIDAEAAISDLMGENQDLIILQVYDHVLHGTVIKWGPASEFN